MNARVFVVALWLCSLGLSGDINREFSTSFVAFPQDCNANPPMLFGGKLLAEMDRCAGIATRRFLYSSPAGAKDAVTVGIDKVRFHKAAKVKDLLVVTGRVANAGKKSVTIFIIVERETRDGREVIADGEYTFVAYDLAEQKAIEHGISLAK